MGNTLDFEKGTELKKAPVPLWDDYRTITFANALVTPHELLYVCRSGSHLFGTATEKSDTDFKGIFLPSKDSCYLNKTPDHFSYSSGKSDSKNTSDDVDFELWSVQKWMELMSKGDSNALSVLFSSANADMVVYCHQKMNDVLMNPYKLYNPTNVDAFVGFSKSQSVKYGLKGNRLQLVENVLQYLQLNEYDDNSKLGDVNLTELVDVCHTDSSKDKDYLGFETQEDRTFLKVLTKLYQTTIPLVEFKTRIQSEFDKYGHRSHLAKDMGGSDWKALSHSLRTLFEASEMLENGFVTYPLIAAKVLLSVKNGEATLDEFQTVYNVMEIKVEELKKSSEQQNHMNLVDQQKILLKMYREDVTNEN